MFSHMVAQRSREMGVRMALGATRSGILFGVLRQAALLSAGGILGVGGALFMARALSRLLFGVRPTDPATFVEAALFLLLVAAAASVLPARRATLANPAVVSRQG